MPQPVTGNTTHTHPENRAYYPPVSHLAALTPYGHLGLMDHYVYPAWKFTWGLTVIDLFFAALILHDLQPRTVIFRAFNLAPPCTILLAWLSFHFFEVPSSTSKTVDQKPSDAFGLHCGKMKTMRRVLIIALTSLIALPATPLSADDGAASIAEGGIVLMKREPRIVMAKEVLTISESKVIVDYDFRNDSDQDITTEVAFPIPDYSFTYDRALPGDAGFDDFKLWIDGKSASFTIQAQALLGKQDVSSTLRQAHVDPISFGHFRDSKDGPAFPDIDHLSQAERTHLIALKLVDSYSMPMWQVQKKYHWQQTFPAHATIHIRHEYTPVLGGTNSVSYGLLQRKESPDAAKELDSLCLTPDLQKSLIGRLRNENTIIPFDYVDFILTTANTWKTPIEDFTLVVQRAHEKGVQQSLVSFCWDGPITKIDEDHFSVHIANLVPKKELRVGFINISKLQ